MSRPTPYFAAFFVLVAALWLAGCPNNSGSSGPTETCESIGQQCKLGGGQLGVCTMNTEGEMRCEPQH